MTDRSGTWTRRQFSQALAATAASAMLARNASALPAADHEGFAFVGCSTADPMGGTVRVYHVSDAGWREVHAIGAASPVHLVMHAAMPVLYIVHGVATWSHRPRGAVSAYRFEAATGHLAHLGTQPLSLSATHPRDAVVAADGGALFVAAESGGIYNVLPVAPDGSLQPVSAIRKEFGLQGGAGGKTAAPRHMVLHPDGSVYATDPGQETITRFAINRDAITLQHRSRAHAGAGAAQLATCGNHVCALRADGGSISTHSLIAGGLSPAVQTLSFTGGNAEMQMHHGGRLFALSHENGLQVLSVNPGDGSLAMKESILQPRLQHPRFTAQGTQLVGVRAASGKVVTHAFDAGTGKLGSPRIVADAPGASSLLLV